MHMFLAIILTLNVILTSVTMIGERIRMRLMISAAISNKRVVKRVLDGTLYGASIQLRCFCKLLTLSSWLWVDSASIPA